MKDMIVKVLGARIQVTSENNRYVIVELSYKGEYMVAKGLVTKAHSIGKSIKEQYVEEVVSHYTYYRKIGDKYQRLGIEVLGGKCHCSITKSLQRKAILSKVRI